MCRLSAHQYPRVNHGTCSFVLARFFFSPYPPPPDVSHPFFPCPPSPLLQGWHWASYIAGRGALSRATAPPRATAVKRNSIARQTEAARSSIDGGGFIWSGLYAQCGSRRSCSGSSWVRFRVDRDKPKNIQNKNNATQRNAVHIHWRWVCRPDCFYMTGPSRVE